MLLRLLHLLLCCATCSLWPVAAWASTSIKDCRDFPIPSNARINLVAQSMLMNGVPMSIKELRSKQSPKEIQLFFRAQWSARGQKMLESEIKQGQTSWQTLASQEGDCFFTVQTQADAQGGTYALLGVSHTPQDTAATPGNAFPMMSNSRVFNDLAHQDGKKTARTLLFDNPFSPASNAIFYRNTLSLQGWQNRVDRQVAHASGTSQIQVWQRGVEELSISIDQRDGKTRMVAQLVNQP
ncbi:MAG: hypothetical protein V4623_04430 [Pseudomonadota bacterium]